MGRICVFGDSIAWGSWDVEAGGWVSRLKVACMSSTPHREDGDTVLNCAIGGDTVGDVLSRFDAEVAARRPDRIVLAVGINDSRRPGATDIDEFHARYEQLVDRSLDVAPNPLVVGLTNVAANFLGFGNEMIAVYNAVIAEIAERHALPFVNAFGALGRDDFILDGVHPSASGHRKMFELVSGSL